MLALAISFNPACFFRAVAGEAALPAAIRVASLQIQVSDDPDRNLARIGRGIREAAQAGARVAVFPEMSLSGSTREAGENIDWPRLEEGMARIATTAGEYRIWVLYGTATPSGTPRPRNSAVLVDPMGREIARYHTMAPEARFEPGDRLALFEIDGVRCTMIIRRDATLPELVRIPALAGARLCFCIGDETDAGSATAEDEEGFRAQLVARASENSVWVVQTGEAGPLPPSGTSSRGCSRTIAPSGRVMQEAPQGEEAMLLCDVRPAEASRRNAMKSLDATPLAGWWLHAVAALKRPSAPAAQSAPARRDRLRLALLQDVPEKWNLAMNHETLLRRVDEAAVQNADLFVTPECWLDGYAAADAGSTVDRLRGIAQQPGSSSLLRCIADRAARRSMWLCCGFTSLEQGRLFNSAGLWNDRGELVGIYHKTHLQAHDLQFSPGEGLPVYPSPWGPLGILICADRRWPEAARTLRVQGARLILNPTFGLYDAENECWMRTRGYENQCFIAFCHPRTGFVVCPGGQIRAKRHEEPGVLICDIDLSESTDDNHIRDRRPDLYAPLVWPRPR